METGSTRENEDERQLELPPGFRFYPSDEELVSHYLAPKVFDTSFRCLAIGEADLNKCEPWDLPGRAKMGEKEWYFFSLKDRKYPTGQRTNRATDSGYWKATGKDKEIYKMKTLVGMKKTLVFYRGRAPKGTKTNWVMHEFRLDGKYSFQNLPKSSKNEWVISRVFEKCSGGKKTHITNLAANGQSISQHLPPLMDSSPYTSKQSEGEGDGSHVTCFSNPMETQSQKTKDELVVNSYLNNSVMPLPDTPLVDYTSVNHFVPSFATQPQPGSLDQAAILRNMLESRRWNNNNSNNNWNLKTEPQQPTGPPNNSVTPNYSPFLPDRGTFHQMSFASQDDHSYAAGGQSSDFDSLWSYFMQ
ncbi:hypothetical protein QQ045_007787 [Rhodiola kirilowii]